MIKQDLKSVEALVLTLYRRDIEAAVTQWAREAASNRPDWREFSGPVVLAYDPEVGSYEVTIMKRNAT